MTNATPKICAADACDATVRCKGFCGMHYRRFNAYGRTELPTTEERFWAKVDKTETCWNWTGQRTTGGYAMFSAKQKTWMAYRYVWSNYVSEIPENTEIDHICHNRLCVKPQHLRLATSKQNKENHQGPSSRSTTGIRGVYWHKASRKWRAVVGHNLVSVELGLFLTAAEAEAAVIAKRLELHTFNDADRLSA